MESKSIEQVISAITSEAPKKVELDILHHFGVSGDDITRGYYVTASYVNSTSEAVVHNLPLREVTTQKYLADKDYGLISETIQTAGALENCMRDMMDIMEPFELSEEIDITYGAMDRKDVGKFLSKLDNLHLAEH